MNVSDLLLTFWILFKFIIRGIYNLQTLIAFPKRSIFGGDYMIPVGRDKILPRFAGIPAVL